MPDLSDPTALLAAEAAARAAGGRVLGSAPAMPSESNDPEMLMRLAAARIQEQEGQLQHATAIAQNMATIIASLVTILVESVPEWSSEEDGSMAVKIMPDAVERAEGASLRFMPSEDNAMAIVVVLAENAEKFAAAQEAKAPDEAAARLKDALG